MATRKITGDLNVTGNILKNGSVVNILPTIASGDAGKYLHINPDTLELEYAEGAKLRQGYYYGGVFWEEPEHLNRMADSYEDIYVDLHTGTDYYFDSTTNAYEELVPKATASRFGIVRLYQALGAGVDGSVTQKAITDALSGKQPLNTIDIDGDIPASDEVVDIPLSEVQADFIANDAELVRVKTDPDSQSYCEFRKTWLNDEDGEYWFLSVVIDPVGGGLVFRVGSVVEEEDPDHPGVTLRVFRMERRDLTKNDVGLGNVDNTSDADKPISRAAQQVLDGKVEMDISELSDGCLALFTPAGLIIH